MGTYTHTHTHNQKIIKITHLIPALEDLFEFEASLVYKANEYQASQGYKEDLITKKSLINNNYCHYY